MFKSRPFALLLAGSIAGCDLPSGPDEARDHLSRGKPRVVPLDLPLPEVVLKVREQLASSKVGISAFIDTSDMTLAIKPTPVSVSFGQFLAFDAPTLPTVRQGYTPTIAPYSMVVPIDAGPIPVTLPEESDSTAVYTSSGGTLTFDRDYSDAYATATFGGSSALRLALTANDRTSLFAISVALLYPAGGLIATAGPVWVYPGGGHTLDMPLNGVTLPNRFRVQLTFQSSTGDGNGFGLRVRSAFVNAAVTSATGVHAGRIQSTRITRNVALSAGNSDFVFAELATGTIALQSIALGDLVFSALPGFETDLAGKRVSAADSDSLRVDGIVAPRPGLSRLDIQTRGQVSVVASNLTVRTAQLRSVAFHVDRRVTLIDPASAEFRGVEEVVVREGHVTIALRNRLRISGDILITLEGATQPNGAPVTQRVTVAASPDERPVTTLAHIPLNGVTLRPAFLAARAQGTLGGNNVLLSTAAANDAFEAAPGISTLSAERVRLAGANSTRFRFKQMDVMTAASAGLTELTDVLKNVELMRVDLTTKLRNGSGIPLVLDSMVLALVRPADSSAIPGANGRPLRLVIDRPGSTPFKVAALSTDSAKVEATEFVNALAQRVIAGEAVGLLASGDVGFDGGSGTLAFEDRFELSLTARTPLDLGIPPSGVLVERSNATLVDLEQSAADLIADLERSLESGALVLELTNSTPFAVRASIALAPTPSDTLDFDPFGAEQRLSFEDIEMAGASTDANGFVITPGVSRVTLPIPVEKLAIFRQRKLGLAVRARLFAPESGRAHLGHDDYIRIVPTARLNVATVESAQ